MAKLKIRNKNFRDNVRVKFSKGSHYRYWISSIYKLTRNIVDLVQEYKEDGYKLTNRQLYYQLVARGLLVDEYGEVANADPIYKKICNVINDLKYNGIIDWEMFEDRSRPMHKNYTENSVPNAIDRTIWNYNLDKLKDQDVYIEVWIEKDALTGVFSPVCDEYDVRLVTNKGYTSSSFIYQAYKRFADKILDEKKCYILYFGDHDPSGIDMIRDIRERVEEFLINSDYIAEELEVTAEAMNYFFEVQQVGLNLEQIEEYDPPENPAKKTDPRYKEYIKKFGFDTSWEVDALEPKVLSRLTKESIERLIDMSKYLKWFDVIEQDKRTLEKLKSYV